MTVALGEPRGVDSRIPEALAHQFWCDHGPAESVNRPAECVNRPAESINRLAECINRLAESVNRLPECINRLPESINRLAESINRLAESIHRLTECADSPFSCVSGRHLPFLHARNVSTLSSSIGCVSRQAFRQSAATGRPAGGIRSAGTHARTGRAGARPLACLQRRPQRPQLLYES
jgi:hypothetical protein